MDDCRPGKIEIHAGLSEADVFITPMGSHGLVHPEGEVATAEGAARTGTLLTVSSASTRSMEDIAKASTAPKWFQMYWSFAK
jgi:L-lactate oxidase